MLVKAKHREVLSNGRNCKKPILRFEDMWAKVMVSLIVHPAWRSLSSSAKDVYFIMLVKNGYAGKCGPKDVKGRPKISFSYNEAKSLLKMPSPTFHRALKELQTKGFIDITEYGGILCGKGRAAVYHLCSKWEKLRPTKKETSDMKKARAARKKEKKEPENNTLPN